MVNSHNFERRQIEGAAPRLKPAKRPGRLHHSGPHNPHATMNKAGIHRGAVRIPGGIPNHHPHAHTRVMGRLNRAGLPPRSV